MKKYFNEINRPVESSRYKVSQFLQKEYNNNNNKFLNI